MEPLVNVDGDSELSFEALTFGDSHSRNHSPDHSDDSPRGKNKQKKPSRKTSPVMSSAGEGSAAIYISSVGDGKIDVPNLLKRLEMYGVVKAYYFKEKQDFGFVQFLDPAIADVVVETLNKNGIDGQPLSVERANGKSSSSAFSLGGTAFSPSTSSLFSPPSSIPSTPTLTALSPPPPEKPDTILVLKNLPFSLKQDQLQEILMQMNSTAPQSINLHFDNAGVFKGMAFIKYRGIEDAIKVFEALNGYDVGGRKVRVEYKRKNKGTQSGDIPQEWCDDEDLKKLWDQIKDFSNNQNMSEISFAPTLSLNHRKHVLSMAEKLKLSAQHSNGESSCICIRKTQSTPTMTATATPSQSSGNGSHSHNENGRAININKPRSRTNSASLGSPRDSATGGSFSDQVAFRSRTGSASFHTNNSSQKVMAHSLSTSDASLDWRNGSVPSPASTPTQGGILIAPIRQPKGPDGTKGFSDVYRNSRTFIKKAIAV